MLKVRRSVFNEVYCERCDKHLHYVCAELKELGYKKMNQKMKAKPTKFHETRRDVENDSVDYPEF